MFDKFFEKVGNIVAKRQLPKIKKSFTYAGYDITNYRLFLGKYTILAILVFIIGLLLPFGLLRFFTKNNGITIVFDKYHFFVSNIALSGLLAISFLTIISGFYFFYIYNKIMLRKQIVERNLPDFLNIVASNISAGMSPFIAINASARPEFGTLHDEIKKTIASSLGTSSFTDALRDINTRIKSSKLKEVIEFISYGLHTGGKLSKLLENTASNLRELEFLRKQLIANTKMYILFLLFIMLLATPLLLSITIQFLIIIAKTMSLTPTGSSNMISFVTTKISLSPSVMLNLSYLLLLGNSLFVSLFLGVLRSGEPHYGIKYFVYILLASIAIFVVINSILPGMFSFIS